MRHRINSPFRGTSSVLILAVSLLLASPLPAAEIEGYTSLDDLPEDAAALPAPPERPWLHHRVTRKKSVQQGNGTPVPAALLPQVQAWQARYRKKAGVREMKNGVLYRVLAAGKGRQIQEGDAVELLLSGYLVDGKAFDDSGEKGRVQRVKPSDLLPSLTGVLTTLRAGSHVEVLLPPDQAFGDEGVKGMIPGGATLRFDIRVLKASAGGETKGN